MKVRPMTIQEHYEETGENKQRTRVRIQNNLVTYRQCNKIA